MRKFELEVFVIMANVYRTVPKYVDKKGNSLKPLKFDDVLSNAEFIKSIKTESDICSFGIYILSTTDKSQSFVARKHTTYVTNIYDEYSFKLFVEDIKSVLENEDYISAVKSVCRSKKIIFTK